MRRPLIGILVVLGVAAVVTFRPTAPRVTRGAIVPPQPVPVRLAARADSAVLIVYGDSRPGHLLMTQRFGARVVYDSWKDGSLRSLIWGAANVPVAALQAVYPGFYGIRDLWSQFVTHRFYGGNQEAVWHAIAANPDVDLIVSAGDAVPNGHLSDGWDEFAALTDSVRAHVPYVIAPGNHEELWMPEARTYWAARFGQPAEDSHYWRDVTIDTLVRVVLLDSNVLSDPHSEYPADVERVLAAAQLAWADSVLALPARFKFVVLHHPLVTAGHHMDTWDEDSHQLRRDRRAQLMAILRRHGATAVFGGHEHLYMRAFVAHANEPGFWSVTTGGGGSPLHLVTDEERARAERQLLPDGSYISWITPEKSVYEYCRLVLRGDSADLRVYRVDERGRETLIDRVDLARPARGTVSARPVAALR